MSLAGRSRLARTLPQRWRQAVSRFWMGLRSMRLDVTALALTAGLLWGAAMLIAASANFVWPNYGQAFRRARCLSLSGLSPRGERGIRGDRNALRPGGRGSRRRRVRLDVQPVRAPAPGRRSVTSGCHRRRANRRAGAPRRGGRLRAKRALRAIGGVEGAHLGAHEVARDLRRGGEQRAVRDHGDAPDPAMVIAHEAQVREQRREVLPARERRRVDHQAPRARHAARYTDRRRRRAR